MICADLGTYIYYAQHGSYGTNGGELPVHNKPWHEVSTAVGDFKDDLKDNGSGTDHGSGGGDFTVNEDGVLPFRNPPDYERPVDGNRDNVYEIPTSIAPIHLAMGTRASKSLSPQLLTPGLDSRKLILICYTIF